MSVIFDALQRSEVERSGVDLTSLSAADVLELAELHVLSERKAQGLPTTPEIETVSTYERSIMVDQESSHLPATHDSPDRHELASSVSALDSVNQECLPSCEHLSISLPLENRLVALTQSESLAAEKFRFLGVRLQHLRRETLLKKILVTSTIPQEGKSTVSANLACTLAKRTQQKTLLIEGDVRRPSLSKMFGLPARSGLCEWLRHKQKPETSIYFLDGPEIWFLPAGDTPDNPLEILQSPTLASMMDQLCKWFDWIVIDSPPIMPLADTSLWMRIADGTLLVARQGVTEKKQLQRGLEAIEPRKLIGALLNGSKSAVKNDYYYSPRSD